MKINYQETTSDLKTRIDIHNKYGGRDIDEWMLETLSLKPGMKILDVGCGAGKQCFSYYNALKGNADITGGDVNQELLDQARKENENIDNKVKFMELNFNERFPFEDNGPMPENKQLFYDIIKEATGKPIPPMPGSSRYASQILTAVKETFAETDLKIFENPLTFESAKPFIDYTRASLNEDRKIWNSLFQGKDEFEAMMSGITQAANRRQEKDGKLVMTKVVGGILATK